LYIFTLCERKVDGKTILINPATEDEISPYDIYAEIARHANKSVHSIRDYIYTSRNVPLSVREAYPQFGRHHLKSLIPHFQTLDELYALCEKVAQWSEELGVPVMSVAALRHRLKENGTPHPEWERRFKRLLSIAKRLADDEGAPAFVRQIASKVIRSEVPLP